ncbi:MAG: zinc ABC transporter substrate-binding protein [Clostridia bacterium]|nr:zinc ABC transporter substrate-binding protein [Clostridia bacterium]
MKLKKVMLIVLAIAIVVTAGFLLIKGRDIKKDNSGKIKIISSNFASYDFLRAIIGDNNDVELTFLIGPGKDPHSYDPTAQDLISIQKSDLFVYIGGEMENWADKVLDAIDSNTTEKICIADFVDTIEEKDVDGAEKEENEHDEEKNGAYDEHIWTSPSNAIKMVDALEKAMEKIDNSNSKKYKENSEKYIAQIKDVDNKIQNIVNNKVRDRLVFGDKMPMQYFIDYYKLKVSSAFNGCSTEIDPSASTIAYLENKVKEENIPVVLYIELNPGKVASIIANEAGDNCQAMQIQALHNVSLDDFNNGETWVSLMSRNIDVLKKALQ